MATAELIERTEPTAEESTKTRSKLSAENVFVFPPSATPEDLQSNKIEREDGSQVDMYRCYTVYKHAEGKEPEIVGYAFGKMDNEALGRFVEAKGYSAEVTFDKPRGAPKGPRVDANLVNSMKKIWAGSASGRSIVLQMVQENKQYKSFFEFNAEELKAIDAFTPEGE